MQPPFSLRFLRKNPPIRNGRGKIRRFETARKTFLALQVFTPDNLADLQLAFRQIAEIFTAPADVSALNIQIGFYIRFIIAVSHAGGRHSGMPSDRAVTAARDFDSWAASILDRFELLHIMRLLDRIALRFMVEIDAFEFGRYF